MDDDSKLSIPLLTSENFLEWRFKMKNVLRGKGLYNLVSGEKLRGADGKFVSADDFPDLKDKALSIISPRIHKSLISTVTAGGGEDDPVVLWKNILNFGSSKKEANVFRAYRNLNLIAIDPTNISASILKFRDAISELKSLDLELDERQLGHLILSKIPPSLSSIQDAIISTGQTSTAVTYDIVLDLLDSKAKTSHVLSSSMSHSTPKAENLESDAATALLTYQCKNGQHDPSAKHSEAQCFAKHPHKLAEYRKRLKDRSNTPETHLTTAEASAKLTNDLVASLASIGVNDDTISEGHESEVSLL
ncbi:uncharacterized protein VP01_4908g1 [Puccinia sorghi]|uniref:Uncharacterized protein n=1 Tax=Puccinia sorghi TaxID=27349 RepID=A0A0L6UM54_9BASI|nr:uncharacterized protein VP01_4908g1 [Puccinia sorghi]